MKCDSCGIKVDSKGYLGGGIVCKTCAKLKRKDKTDELEQRREKYGGGND
jgi:hypothetical protein